jgi:CheY-like chemotaxis protein
MRLGQSKLRIFTIMLSVPLSIFGQASVEAKPKGCRVSDECYSSCVSTRDCDLQSDTRNCSRTFILGITITDPACEANKAAQNQIHAIQKSSCEASKTEERAQCESRKAACLSVADACSSILLREGARINGSVILWVDDHPANNVYQVQALSELGARVVLANTTQEGMAKLQAQHVDLVISDFERTDDPRGGYTLLTEVRKRSNPPPFVIFSSSSTPEFAAEARRRGAFGETNNNGELFNLVAQALSKNKRR